MSWRLVSAAMLVFIGCAGADPMPNPKDWLTPEGEISKSASVPAQHIPIQVIPGETRNQAIDLLRDAQIVELTGEQLARLSGGNLAALNPQSDPRTKAFA